MSAKKVIRLVLVLCYAAQAHLFGADASALSARDLVRKGSEQFFDGEITNSIDSFERAVKLQPALKPHLWQLGISYYYAERFVDGRDLFELHQQVNPQDVENAVWHFLCVARLSDVETARKKLIKITDDQRVPMRQVHALFAGTGSREEVLKAAAAVPGESTRKGALCYAHLYLALYEEASGNKDKSREHIEKAANDYRQEHYMGQVARVHAQLRSAPKQ